MPVAVNFEELSSIEFQTRWKTECRSGVARLRFAATIRKQLEISNEDFLEIFGSKPKYWLTVNGDFCRRFSEWSKKHPADSELGMKHRLLFREFLDQLKSSQAH